MISLTHYLSVAVGAAVVVLLVLAVLQYRWSRQVGAAVGDHIGATLKASMLDWHLNLVRELSAPCMAMHLHSPVKDWEPTIEDYEQWATTSENAQMVEDVYALQQRGGVLKLLPIKPGHRADRNRQAISDPTSGIARAPKGGRHTTYKRPKTSDRQCGRGCTARGMRI